MRIRYYVFLILFILTGCIKEQFSEQNGVRTFDCFTVTMEDDPLTKSHIENGGAVKWDVGDCIGVYSDIQGPVQYTRGEDGKFYGETVSGTKFYAFYPWSQFKYDSSNPEVLHYSCDSFWGDTSFNAPMVAVSQSNALSFKQTVGLLHFRLKGKKNLISIKLLPNDNREQIFGRGRIDLSEESPLLVLENEMAWEATANPVCADQGEWSVFFPIPVMTMQEGFLLQITCADPQTMDNYWLERVFCKELQIVRGFMKSFSVIDLDDMVQMEIEEIEKAQQLWDGERLALIALYDALDGPNWANNTNWCTDMPVDEWYGITTNRYGLVESINLSSNRLRGEIPEEIGVFSMLKQLWLGTVMDNLNIISGPLPASISNLKSLEVLDLMQNRIEGPFPEGLRGLTKLRELNLMGAVDFSNGERLDYDYLNGSIPEWIGELKSLQYLTLCNNRLEGSLPESLSQLIQLEVLDLGANQLTGPLPDVSNMQRLRNVSLQGNMFSGDIPPGFSTVLDNPDLSQLWLNLNCLSGSVAPEVLGHPEFGEWVWGVLSQKEGYKLTLDETKVPASRYTYDTLEGESLDLGAQYKNSPYTMIVRWTETCNPSRIILPKVIQLAKQYADKGLQTIWAYGGGEEQARISYMKEVGLDQLHPHIIECHQQDVFGSFGDHAVWRIWIGYRTPFIEIVDSEGNIVFLDDDEDFYKQYSFAHHRSDLEFFVASLFGDVYESTDYTADGTVHTLQTATEGAGINVVLMGDAFSDRMIEDGTYNTVMNNAMEAFFSEEPYKSFRNLFNVYSVDVVSKNEVYLGETALETFYGDGTYVGGNDDKTFEYARKALTDAQMDEAMVIVMLNRDYYAGTCYMYYTGAEGDYGQGPAIAYFPTSSDAATFAGLVSHEAGGHGFAKLADEYSYEGSIPDDEAQGYKDKFPLGWWKNIDFTDDLSQVKWAQFLSDERYSNEGLGVYEGGCTYALGVWHPTVRSIMNLNTGGFNAPSRYAIWYRIGKLAYGDDWAGGYEDFVAYDAVNRQQPTAASRHRSYVEKQLPPLAPPVVVSRDWRDAIK